MSPQMSPITFARIAGALYITIAVAGAFSIGYLPSVIIAPGDAAATVDNLLNNQGLFRLGILADVIVLLAEIALTAMLYVMFRSVSRTLSLVAAFARLAMILVMGTNLQLNLVPLLLLTGGGTADAFATQQAQAIVLLVFEIQALGVYVWGIFFSLHLFALGILMIRSGFFPRVLGAMIQVGSFAYLLDALTQITGTGGTVVSAIVIGLLVIVTVAELTFAFWLLIRGPNISSWNKLNPIAA